MSTFSSNRPALKSLSFLIQPQLLKQKEQEVMYFQPLSQKMVLTIAEQCELFQKLLTFLQEFLLNQTFYTNIIQALYKNRSSKKVLNAKQEQRILSFKKMNMGSRVCFDGETTRSQKKKEAEEEGRNVRGNSKKISIFVLEQDYPSDQNFSDEIITQKSVKTIRSIQIPEMKLNLSTISLIYDSPQPFLINLSLCLFIRYCFLTKRKVEFEESAWVLSVATILAYKLYYDQEVEGLIDCFTNIMKISREDLIDLQRCFFQQIDYNTVILNYDYYFVLSTLLSMKIENTSE